MRRFAFGARFFSRLASLIGALSAGVAAAAEMGLDGSLRPVRGAMAMAEAAARMDVAALLLAPESAAEAAAVEGVRVLPARTLSAGDWLAGLRDESP